MKLIIGLIRYSIFLLAVSYFYYFNITKVKIRLNYIIHFGS